MTIQLDYQRERFADDTVRGWLADYVEILRRFAADPYRHISVL
jgi:hypothetical protein